MNRTELKVYIDGVWHDVDINDKIAINYQWYDLNDTSLRYVPYSQSLNIPLTQRNSKTFKHCNRFDSTTDILRRFIPTKLFEDGIKIADGYMNILSASLKNLEVNVVSSADFFYLLKQKDEISGKPKTLNDLDWTDELLRSTDSFLSNKDDKDIFFAVADFDKGDDNNKSVDVRNHIFYPENQKPFVWFDSIMEKILAENGGYTLISGIKTDRLAVPLASINKKYNVDDELCKGVSASSISRVLAEGVTQLESVLNAVSTDPNKISITTEGTKLEALAGAVLKYECEITGTYIFKLNFKTAAKVTSTIYNKYLRTDNYRRAAPIFGDGIIYGSGFTVDYPYAYFAHNIFIRKNGEEFYSKSAVRLPRTVDTTTATTRDRGIRDNRTVAPDPYYTGTVGINVVEEIVTVELNAGDILTFEHSNYYEKTDKYSLYYVGTPFLYIDEVTRFDVDLTYIKPKIGVVPMGINIPIKDNMPEMTQYDFMMSYFNMYGLIPFADKIEKKIYAYNMRSIIDNKVNNYFDWSDKYVKETGEFTTSIESYGKKSYIKYKEVSRNVEGDGDVVINEETAEQLFDKGIIIKYYPLEASTNFELISKLVDTWVAGAYKYLTLAAVVDESDLTIVDEAYIVCDDDSLESEKDIIEIGFNANEIYTAKDYVDAPFSYAKFRDGADNVLAVYKNPRIVVINRGYILLAECAAEGVSNQMKLVQVASSYNTDAFEQVVTSIDMNNLIDNYKPLQDNILSDVKYITGAQFALNKLDIEALSPYTPIYVEAFGAMFYVNKINNYLPDTLVSVDLIKI